jgi:hypothetical protein
LSKPAISRVTVPYDATSLNINTINPTPGVEATLLLQQPVPGWSTQVRGPNFVWLMGHATNGIGDGAPAATINVSCYDTVLTNALATYSDGRPPSGDFAGDVNVGGYLNAANASITGLLGVNHIQAYSATISGFVTSPSVAATNLSVSDTLSIGGAPAFAKGTGSYLTLAGGYNLALVSGALDTYGNDLILRRFGTEMLRLTDGTVAGQPKGVVISTNATVKGSLTVSNGITLGGVTQTTWPSGGASYTNNSSLYVSNIYAGGAVVITNSLTLETGGTLTVRSGQTLLDANGVSGVPLVIKGVSGQGLTRFDSEFGSTWGYVGFNGSTAGFYGSGLGSLLTVDNSGRMTLTGGIPAASSIASTNTAAGNSNIVAGILGQSGGTNQWCQVIHCYSATNILGGTNFATGWPLTNCPFQFTVTPGRWEYHAALQVSVSNSTSGINCTMNVVGSDYLAGMCLRGVNFDSTGPNGTTYGNGGYMLNALCDAPASNAWCTASGTLFVTATNTYRLSLFQRSAAVAGSPPMLMTNSYLLLRKLP